MVEALHARDDKARGEVFRYICISAHAESVSAVVGETTLQIQSERIEHKIASLTPLIADARSQIAAGIPIGLQLPRFGDVDAEIRIIAIAIQTWLHIELLRQGVADVGGERTRPCKDQCAIQRPGADTNTAVIVDRIVPHELRAGSLPGLQDARVDADVRDQRLESDRLPSPAKCDVWKDDLGA